MKGKEGGMETVQVGRCEGKGGGHRDSAGGKVGREGGEAWRQCRWEGVKGRRGRMETVQKGRCEGKGGGHGDSAEGKV